MSTLKDKATVAKEHASELLHSSRGRDMLLFLVFLVISFVFWLLLTLNNEVQEDIEIPVELTSVPDSVTLISSMPDVINVSVRDKGSSLVRYVWGRVPVMGINFNDYAKDDNRMILNETELNGRVRSFFGNGVQIVSVKPDSINLFYTSSPGRKAAVVVNADVKPNYQYIISGNLMTNVDSVRLFSVDPLPAGLTSVKTMPIVLTDLRDTTTVEVRLVAVAGVRIIPDRISVTVPVEPLISKRQIIPIEVRNIPAGMGMITFPSKIEASYLVPMSSYNEARPDIKAYVDFASTLDGSPAKLPVAVSYHADAYRNLSFTPDSVEYVIERK
ncbi:MAG: hypothetical protein NC117_02210 [Pseudoflavonifractor sp.]|nr:hypothetical protein [Pseudoflavonifractor sp.]